jgi:hypothetical protein
MKNLIIFIFLCTGIFAQVPYKSARFPSKTVLAGSGGDPHVITGQTPGTLRADGGGFATGFQFTVGGASKVITAVGRYKAAGDSASHFVAIYTGSAGAPVTNGSATINMSNAADADGYVYVTLATPITVSASTIYRCMSVEATGVDHFYDSDTSVTANAVISVDNGCYDSGGAAGGGSTGTTGGANHAYGPVNFKFH